MKVDAAQVLLVEDNPGDVVLMRQCLERGAVSVSLNVVTDGLAALSYLRREAPFQDAPRPDLVLLDLNLPKLEGREVLARVKADASLRTIPVLVLSSSAEPADVMASYERHANGYMVKPLGFEQYSQMVVAMEEFWFGAARLPGCTARTNP